MQTPVTDPGRGLKDRILTQPQPFFSQPVRQVVLMLVVCALVAAGAWLILAQIRSIFASNPWLNGTIVLVFLLGVLTCFWQVVQLAKSVSWIERFVAGRTTETAQAPILLAPLAALLRGRVQSSRIATSSARTILESVEDRIEEGRDITRYLANLLIFLGLLGTFYGLATTVPAVVQTIRALAPQPGESSMAVFDRLMHGLESQLGGMGTAFSSSLLGLAGSLVVGLLELFASHGQNRFYRELEEWLSSISRISLAGEGSEGGEGGNAQVIDYMVEQMGALQDLVARTNEKGQAVDHRLAQLAGSVERLAQTLEAGTASEAHLVRIAEGQERIAALLERGATDEGPYGEAETRMRLRSIDVQLLRLLEEVAAGRQEAVGELRGDLAALTRAVRALGAPETVTGRRG
ncbi:biopolymer transporter ExbB [Frigidibacter sp. MR17.14]|uniref:biopolymer transporter ExbB n=1 Tax=Frigidibacter sp. MR17.14 TaxID=3126509 RepID=UPI003012D16E